jgi:hypothetical protein
MYGSGSSMRTYHVGGKLGLRFLEIMYAKGGAGVIFTSAETPLRTVKTNNFEMNANLGFIMPMGFLGLQIEGTYRHVFTVGDASNFWGGSAGIIIRI